MWEEVREPSSIIRAAEKAAEAGHHAKAENLLREAARLQEESLGPRHPDLGSTLNNLGIVCEMSGKLDDAEQYFRRAVSIARTSLAPEHPFVATSQKNLRDFCEARGRKVELPAPAPEPPAPAPAASTPAAAAPPTPAPPAPVPPAPAPAAPAPAPRRVQGPAVTETVAPKPKTITPQPKQTPPQLPPDKLFYRFAMGALGPIAALMVVLAVGLPRLESPPQASPLPELAIDARPDIVPPREPAAVEATPVPAPAVAAAEPIEPAPAVEARAIPEVTTTTTRSGTPASPVVLKASLCSTLDDWLCDPADDPVTSGPLFFYTKIRTDSAITVQHLWYRDNREHHRVTLQVQPGRDGYRTFSRNLMTSESAGSWRVELRGEDGTLLHEERFTVR